MLVSNRTRLVPGNPRRQHEPLLVAVRHYHHADRARCQSPRVLEGKTLLLRLVLVLDVEDARKGVPQAVRGRALNGAPGSRGKRLDGCSVVCARESVSERLAAKYGDEC